jgi:signal transduction histidine kinase
MEDELRPPFARRVISGLSQRQWFAIDIAVAVLLVAPQIGSVARSQEHFDLSGTGWDIARYVALVVIGVALPFRRRNPVPVLIIVSSFGAFALALQVQPSLASTLALSIYSVSAVSSSRTSQVSLGGVVAVVLLAVAIANPHDIIGVFTSTSAVVFAAWLVGLNSRSRRRYAAAVAERAAERELEREERLSRAVADERISIARDLHDIVAHAMSVIAVRSGVARMVIESRPDEAREALGIIETTTRRALREMRLLVGVLRGANSNGAAREPAPGLADLDELIDQAGDAGVKVTTEIDGDPQPLPEGAELSAYRIIQEALTNVVRHAGPTRVKLHIGYLADELLIDIVDEGSMKLQSPNFGGQDSGHGLIGMQERAALYGGTLTAGPHGHGFQVHATLPTSESVG